MNLHSLPLSAIRMSLLSAWMLVFLTAPAWTQPLLGDYTINAGMTTGGTNFQSFTDFANAINNEGISGDVTVTVTPDSGPYQEQIIINTVAGAGPDASVTLEGSGETISAATNTDNRYVIRLANVSYFTINNLLIERDLSSTSGFMGVHLYNTADHITISNCEVYINGTTSTLTGGFVASNSETSLLENGNFQNISVLDNFTKGGGYGVSIVGLDSDLANNILIGGNTFQDFHSNGVYLKGTDGAVIRNNQLKKTPESSVSSCNAIQMAQAANINAEIFNNFIEVTQTTNGNSSFNSTIRGIYLFNGTGHKVYNNVIHNILLETGDFTAIEIRTAGTAPEIYYNTISLDHSASNNGELFGIKESLSNTNAILRNNLISMTQPNTGIKTALVIGTIANPTTAFDSDYNLLWVPDGNVAMMDDFTSPTYYTSLNTWQNVSMQDVNSLAIDPMLESLLLPKPTNLDIDDQGVFIPGILLDVLGITRGTPPDIGAYEFGGCPPPPAPISISGPDTLCANATNILYEADVNGGTTFTWSVPADATISSGQGTPGISVDFGAQSGEVSLVAEDSCGTSLPTALDVTVNNLPDMPGPIDGPGLVCIGDTGIVYTVNAIPEATSYEWEVPFGTTITAGQGTNSITINVGDGAGFLTVTAINECGSSDPAELTLLVHELPDVNLDLSIDSALCTTDEPISLSGGTPVNGTYSGPGVENGIFDPMTAGAGEHQITYTFTDPVSGCSNEANSTLVVENCTAVEESVRPALKLYPNPSNGRIWLSLPADASIDHLLIFNKLGQLEMEIQSPQRELDLQTLSSGWYLVKVLFSSGQTAVQPLILQ